MSLSTLAVAVLSLTTPDPCNDARDFAESIARARDSRVPITAVLDIVESDQLWTTMVSIIYSYSSVPPVAIGAMAESACRDNS